jgi:hypothetical protein
MLWERQGEWIDEGNDGRISCQYRELKKEQPEHLKRELSRWVFQQAQAHTPSLLFVQMWELRYENFLCMTTLWCY